jgi:hypothetical protein
VIQKPASEPCFEVITLCLQSVCVISILIGYYTPCNENHFPSVYFVNQPLHVSDIFVAHHQEVYSIYTVYQGTRWRSWLRHCATSRKVAGSIPDDVIGIFH